MDREGIIRSLKMSMTIVGTTIGAGFASGREVWEFFGSYGSASRSSLLLSTLLFTAAIIVVLEVSRRLKTKDYIQLLTPILGEKLTRIFDFFILLYLMTGTVVMFAGSGATFKQLNFSYILGVTVLAIGVIVVLSKDVKGILSINSFLMPLLTIILAIVCIQFLMTSDHIIELQKPVQHKSVWPPGVAYAALNIVPLVAVLSTIGTQLKTTTEVVMGGSLGAFLLGGIAVLLNQSLLRLGDAVQLFDIPLFALVEGISPLVVFGISLILWLAIFTTAVSNIYGIVSRLTSVIVLPKLILTLVIVLLAIPLTQFGFAILVQILYPLYGVLNLFILFMILLFPLNRDNNPL